MGTEEATMSQTDNATVPGLDGLRQWRQDIRNGVAPDSIGAAPSQASELEPEPLPDGPTMGERLFDLWKRLKTHLVLTREDSLVIEDPADRRWLVPETVIVLGVSLGSSAIWAILQLIDIMTSRVLSQTTVSMNNSVTPDRPWLDLLNQVARIVLTLVPVLLAFYLLALVRRPSAGPLGVMGLNMSRAVRDIALGVLLAACIGIPGLGLYAVARAVGINATIAAGNLTQHWWTVPIYVLLAAMNGILEEVVMIGYLFTRWTQRGLGPWPVIVISALIRGSYHLYQGFGGFIGNVTMGIIFGWVFMRTKRVLPLVIAHTILDIVSFVGYSLLVNRWAWLK